MQQSLWWTGRHLRKSSGTRSLMDAYASFRTCTCHGTPCMCWPAPQQLFWQRSMMSLQRCTSSLMSRVRSSTSARLHSAVGSECRIALRTSCSSHRFNSNASHHHLQLAMHLQNVPLLQRSKQATLAGRAGEITCVAPCLALLAAQQLQVAAHDLVLLESPLLRQCMCPFS